MDWRGWCRSCETWTEAGWREGWGVAVTVCGKKELNWSSIGGDGDISEAEAASGRPEWGEGRG